MVVVPVGDGVEYRDDGDEFFGSNINCRPAPSFPATGCIRRLLLKPGTGRDNRGISRPVPPTKTRDGIEFYCRRIRRKGSRLASRRQASANVRGSMKER